MRVFPYAITRHLRFLIHAVAALLLSSCQETEKLKAEAKDTQQKVAAVQQELLNMDIKMADYRKAIPSYAGQGEVGAKRYAVEVAKELAGVEAQIADAKQSIQTAQAALESAKAEFEAVKAKDPRLVK